MTQTYSRERRSMRNNYRKPKISGIVIFVVIALVLGTGCVWLFTGGRAMMMPKNSITVYPNPSYVLEPVNATLDETGMFAPLNDDPRLPVIFENPVMVQSFRLSLKDALKEGITLELYYCDEGEKFSEDRVQRFEIPENSTEFITAFPAGMCKRVRVDLNGTALINSIEFGSSNPVNAVKWFTWLLLVLFIVDLIMLYLLIENSTAGFPVVEWHQLVDRKSKVKTPYRGKTQTVHKGQVFNNHKNDGHNERRIL